MKTTMSASIRHALQAVLLLAVLAPWPAAAQNRSAPVGESASEVAGEAPQRPSEAPQRPSEAPQRIGPVSNLPLPRFVALRASAVNLRTGPGLRYPIDWLYKRPGLPIEVIDEFETWRRVRDWEGSIGWVHQNMLTRDRRALVVGRQRLLRRSPEDKATGLALLEAGVITRLIRCADGWCQLEIKGIEGWLREDEIYGVNPGEIIR